MVMFKARYTPVVDKPRAASTTQQQQQQPQPVPPQPRQNDQPKAPPIEKERGPQYPIKEPGPGNPPERAR